MRVVYALRADAESKPGGDSRKVRRYIERLGALGIESTVALSMDELRSARPDVVHCMNLDLPVDNLLYIKWANRHSVPVVLSTILHPIDGTEAFFRNGDDRFNRLARGLGLSFSTTYKARDILRAPRSIIADPTQIIGSQRDDIRRELIKSCEVVLPMCAGEAAELRRLAGDSPMRLEIVPNARTFSTPTSGASAQRRNGVACLGRIEPRKNQVNLARGWVAAGTPEVLRFAGGLNWRHPSYVRKFLQLVEENSNIEWLGSLHPEAVGGLLANSRAHFNASWYEVVSQADLEALSAGTPIVTTRHSYLQDYVEGEIVVFDPMMGLDDAKHLTDAACAAAGDTRLKQGTTTWTEVGTQLVELYRSLEG